MSIKWDKEKIVLSAVGSLVVAVIGYLIWRHENATSQSEAAANLAAQQSDEANQDAELQQELAALPQYASGGGASDEENDTGSDSTVASPSQDNELASILAAFFPSTTTPTTPTTPAPPTPVTGPSTPTPIPIGNPASPTSPLLPVDVSPDQPSTGTPNNGVVTPVGVPAYPVSQPGGPTTGPQPILTYGVGNAAVASRASTLVTKPTPQTAGGINREG